MSDEGSRCQVCKCPVPTLWTYCEDCRRWLAVEDRAEALEEIAWRREIQEEKR
jgi:hypothetical protein